MNSLSSLRKFWPYLWPKDLPSAQRRFAIATVALILSKTALMVTPLVFKAIIDFLSHPTVRDIPYAFICLYGFARITSSLFSELRDITFARVTERAVRSLTVKIFNHLHSLSLRFHLDRQTGGLTRIIERGTKSVEMMLTFLTFNIIPTILEIILAATILWWMYDWRFATITVLTMAGYIFYTLKLTEWRISYVRLMNESDNIAQTKAIDSLLNYETVKYFNNESHESKRFDKAMHTYEDAAVQGKKTLSALNIGQVIIITCGLTLNLLLNVYGIVEGTMTVGDLVAINTFLIQLYIPLFNLGFAYREIKMGLVNLKSMFDLLDEPQEIIDQAEAKPLEVTTGTVIFKDVHFSYQPERPILKGISFTIPGGKTLAIVGPSGAGKSTIARLLFRFYDVTDGSITIDNQDIRFVAQSSLRKEIGIVPQDTVLFNDTIEYNIAYGDPSATHDQIVKAAKQAEIHDFIISLPDQYNTRVGERGLKLSGGEKQRVAIARTLLKNPHILIFDEATSALDTSTEKAIQTNLNHLSTNKTTIIIAHRLSTITHVDEIIVLDHGKISERGQHTNLLAQGGLYALLWNKQLVENNDLSV